MRGSVIVGGGVSNASLSSSTTTADTSNQTMTTTNMTQSTLGQDISLQESPIVLNTKQIDNSTSYVWENNGTNNPTLNLMAGKEYAFVVKSIVGDPAEHELKVALPGGTGIEGEDFLESESVEQGEQTQVSFTPTGVGEFRYYCQYHPESMVGMLNVVNTNSSGINNPSFTSGNQGPFVDDRLGEDRDDDGDRRGRGGSDDDSRGNNRGPGSD